MGTLRLADLLAIALIVTSLTVSFFILVTLRKIKEKWLKGFGYVVVVFLLLVALVIFSGVVRKVVQGSAVMKYMLPQEMNMGCMSPMRQNDNPPGMAMSGKDPLANDGKRPGTPQDGVN